ncbi:MAG: protein kinase, partial [Planctomycetes bacterium]|nr:protein kinase [Planctomycetota bacterium]
LSPARLATWLQMQLSGEPVVAEDSAPSGRASAQADSFTGASTTGRGRAYFQYVARWIADVADALNYAHQQKIIHRDIKPGNLILSTDFRIMIADFGLAKIADEDTYTQTGTLIGTLRYLSPEQAMAKRTRTDHRTDIYSLGATMYELLCFQPAFGGTDQKEILGAIIARDPPTPQKISAAVPPELSTICMKCLEKLPDARYATARALADDLRRYLQDLPIVAKRPGPIRRAGKFIRRHRAVAIAVLAGLVLTGAASSYLVGEKRREARVAEQNALQAARVAERNALVALDKAKSDQKVQEGYLLTRQQKWKEAAEAFDEALDLNPQNAEAWGNYAILKKERFNSVVRPDAALLRQALEYADNAIRFDPDIVRSFNTKGVVLKKLGRYEEAARAYAHALALNPDHGEAHENLGVLHALRGDLESAQKSLLRSTEITGTFEGYCEYPWRNLVSLELLLKKREAIDDIRNAIECKKDDPNSWLLRARSRIEIPEHQDFRAALRYAESADVLAEGTNAMAKRTLAMAHLYNEDYASAIVSAAEAIELDDVKTVNHLIRAVAYARLGNRVEARREHARALEYWPDTLREVGAYSASAPKGILWFETADCLLELRRRVEELLPGSRDDS